MNFLEGNYPIKRETARYTGQGQWAKADIVMSKWGQLFSCNW